MIDFNGEETLLGPWRTMELQRENKVQRDAAVNGISGDIFEIIR